ncbi:unnamed protein product [Cyclocybe aegerita]|uniref:Uncharacterized protein n=1 Tax=Cyclocybe aegerita TaxID=1973307 RepID=A0A8S0WBJ2_CYCAE|nr:unnamed protein product [Cyclocybe aegerita]
MNTHPHATHSHAAQRVPPSQPSRASSTPSARVGVPQHPQRHPGPTANASTPRQSPSEHPPLPTNLPHPPGCQCVSCSGSLLPPSTLFPRREDGRIVLPPPWLATRAVAAVPPPPPPNPGHVPVMYAPSATAATSVPVASAHDRGGVVVRDERAGSWGVHVNVDKGEGTSSGPVAHRLTGPGVVGLHESSPFAPPLHPVSVRPAAQEQSRGPAPPAAREKRSGRAGRSKRAKHPKPYDLSERAKPAPILSGLDQPEHGALSDIMARHTSVPKSPFTSYHATIPPSINVQHHLDPYESSALERFPQYLDPSSQPRMRHANASSSSTALSQTLSTSSVAEQSFTQGPHPSFNPHHMIRSPYSTYSNIRPEQLPPSPGPPAPPPPHREVESYPQTSRTTLTRQSRNSHTNTPTIPPNTFTTMAAQPAAASSPGPSSQYEEQAQAAQIRFQDPVVPEDHIASPIRQRQLSIVQVKWESDRKRRQGYFSQEEGAEKSNFRHYNKEQCDYNG